MTPAGVQGAFEGKRDRRDALLLAKLVWADASLLRPIHHGSEERTVGLTVLRARDALVVGRGHVRTADVHANTLRLLVLNRSPAGRSQAPTPCSSWARARRSFRPCVPLPTEATMAAHPRQPRPKGRNLPTGFEPQSTG